MRPLIGGALFSFDDVERFLLDVDLRLEPLFDGGLRRMVDIAPLKTGVTAQVKSGGKRIRAALTAAACEVFGTPYVQSLDFAAAMEHLHNFTLVHDDIADGDAQRRSQPSTWKQYGVPHAINIGDAFLPLASLAILNAPYSERTKVQLLTVMSEYGLQMVEGQALDIGLRARDDVTLEEYLECTAKKTGAFLAMAMIGGGVIGGAAESDLVPLRDFAMVAGIAFQIRDDLLDMEGGKGRSRGSDILEGKRTLMVIHAGQRLPSERRRELYARLDKSREAKSLADIEWVWDACRAAGSDRYAEDLVTELTEEGCQHLLALPESEAKYRLLSLARYLGSRKR